MTDLYSLDQPRFLADGDVLDGGNSVTFGDSSVLDALKAGDISNTDATNQIDEAETSGGVSTDS